MRIIKYILLTLSLFFLSSELFAQNAFIKYYKHGINAKAFALKEHSNGDIAFLIKFSDSTTNGVDFGIHKIDQLGNTQDSFYYNRFGNDYTEDLVIKNNNYYLTGTHYDDYNQVAFGKKLFYKINSVGDTICKTYYNSLGNSYSRKILERNNLFYLIGDEIDTNGTLNATLNVVDSNGIMLHSSNYGGLRQDWAYSGIFTNDKGLILAGDRYSSSSAGISQVYLVKTDSIGIAQWTQTIFKPMDSLFGCDLRTTGIIQAKNGDYFIVGKQTMCDFDPKPRSFLICTDSLGYTKWFKTSPFFPGDNSIYQENLQAIVLSKDGNIVCLGGRFAAMPGSIDDQYDVFLTKFDLNGKKIWTRQYGKTDYYETPYDLIATADGGFAICGRYAPVDYFQLLAEGVKSLIIKTDACGCVVPGCDPNCISIGIEQIANKYQFKVYPNPATNKLSIESNFVVDSYIIYDLLGAKHLEGKYNSNIDISTLAKGMYLIQMENETSFSTIKFIKE
jgi:hypothetical protein